MEEKWNFLKEEVHERWLKNDEIFWILKHVNELKDVPWIYSSQNKPKSGSIFFYDRHRAVAFKRDGWDWHKKKGKNSVREDHFRLSVEGEKQLQCSYAHAIGNETFHRRSYRLFKDPRNQNIMFVHYFDTRNGVRHRKSSPKVTKFKATPNRSTVKSAKDPMQKQPPVNRDPSDFTYSQTLIPPPPSLRIDSYGLDNRHDDDILSNIMNDHHQPNSPIHILNDNQRHDEPLVFHNDMNFAIPGLEAPPQLDIEPENGGDPMILDYQGPEAPLKRKIEEKEPLVSCKISDFSPNWDFTCGGAKILICLDIALPTSEACGLVVCFDKNSVPAEVVSSSVLRCSAPPNKVAQVNLYVARRGSEDIPLTDKHSFSYCENAEHTVGPKSKGNNILKRERAGPTEASCKLLSENSEEPQALSSASSTSSDSPDKSSTRFFSNQFSAAELERCRDFKIRVVERPSYPRPQQVQTPGSDANEPELLDDHAVAELGDTDLEMRSEQLIQSVVEQLVVLADSHEELQEELNSPDEAGLSLLHYVCFYNYAALIPLLLSHGARINQLSAQGHSPLHLAAGCGHWEIVKLLLQSNADPTICDPNGCTAADCAENNDHIELAHSLRTLSGEGARRDFHRGRWHSYGQDDNSHRRFVDDAAEVFRYHGILAQDRSLSQPSDGQPYDTVGISTQEFKDEPSRQASVSNRQLLLGAFSSMSLHDKCALSLGVRRNSVSNILDPSSSSATSCAEGVAIENNEIRSNYQDELPIDQSQSEASCKLEAAMELMGPDELDRLEEEAKVIQHNVRGWLLRRSYKNMRDATCKLQDATRRMMDRRRAVARENAAAVTVQAATRSMLARKNYLHTRNVAIKFQAATRGALCRKNFRLMKKQALASLVIQRNVRAWLDKPCHSPRVVGANTDMTQELERL